MLDALLTVEFDGVERLRDEARGAAVVGGCDCGCPSIDFYSEPGVGMQIHVNAQVDGTLDGLFLYTAVTDSAASNGSVTPNGTTLPSFLIPQS